MSKSKYKYIHLYNGKEVSKGDFYRKLSFHFFDTFVTDSTNPLMNIDLVDEKATDKEYNRLKRTGGMHIFCNEEKAECFQIKRERME